MLNLVMRKTFLSFVIVILLIIVVNQIFIIVSTILNPKLDLDEIISADSENKINKNALPPYSPDWMTWTVADTKDPQSIKNLPLATFLSTESGELTSDILLSGREWISTQSYKTNEELKNSKDTTSHYINQLYNNKWSHTVEIENSIINGVAANSEFGNVLSFLKTDNKNMHVFILSTQIDTNKCPCTTTTRIFINNPIPFSEILKSYKN